jgi:hypothetical protein
VVTALVAWGCALAGCASPGVEQRGATGNRTTAERQTETTYREMFEQTVPSIDAALPLATVVDSVIRKDGEEFVSRAWFSEGQPVCMKVFLIESGDTTAADHFYYQRGRLAAWFKTLHWRKGEPGWPHHVAARALIGPNGKPRRVVMWKDGQVVPVDSPMASTIIRMSAEMESGLREILARKASRTASPS